MSTMHNNTPRTPDRRLGAFLKVTNVFLLIFLAGGSLLVVPAFAQSTEAANTKTGSVLGTVVDTSDDPVPDAAVVLQGPVGNRLAAVTKEDGSFAFPSVTPGIVYQVTVTAEGFAEWTSSIAAEPGQEKTLADVKLRILAVQRAVTVNYSEKEVAAQQFKAEEQQRVLRFIPNTLCDLRTPSRASHHADEVPLGIQKSHQSSFPRPRGRVGRRRAGC